MDGQGLTLDSGTHGKRGYEGAFPFCWLGATTYLPKATFEAMSNVGNRIFFCDTAPPRPTVEELAHFAQKGGSAASEEECIYACQCLLHHLYTEHIDHCTLSGSMEKPKMSGVVSRYIAVTARTIVPGSCDQWSGSLNFSNGRPMIIYDTRGSWRYVKARKLAVLGEEMRIDSAGKPHGA